MSSTSFLAYYSEESSNGDNYYYFRNIFVPDGALTELVTDLLELATGVELMDLFTKLPVTFPEMIEEGTHVYSATGYAFVAPADLYLVCIKSFPASATLEPPEITDLHQNGNIAVYSDRPPDTDMPDDMPAAISPNTFTPNAGASYPNFYWPSSYGAFFAYGAWFSGGENRTDLSYWGLIYGDQEPSEGHILEHPELFEFKEYSGLFQIYYHDNDGSAGYARDSQYNGEYRGPWYIEVSGGVQGASTYLPISSDPGFWFHDDLLGITYTDTPPSWIGPAAALFIGGILLNLGPAYDIIRQSIVLGPNLRHGIGSSGAPNTGFGDSSGAFGDDLG